MLFELGGVTSACVRTKKKNKTSMIVADRGKSHQNKHRNNVGQSGTQVNRFTNESETDIFLDPKSDNALNAYVKQVVRREDVDDDLPLNF